MTKDEALVEAQKRWGENAEVIEGDWSVGVPYEVGFLRDVGMFGEPFVMCGAGQSWSGAFADADIRATPLVPGWIPCFRCGDDLEVETVGERIVTWPAVCPSCHQPYPGHPEGKVERE